MRDHSIADLRDWKNFHRYAIHFLTLENGDRLTVGIISTPVLFSRYECNDVKVKAQLLNFIQKILVLSWDLLRKRNLA